MKNYPRVGTRIRITAGEYAGRQGRTDKTVEGHGRIQVTLLGGIMKIGVAVKLEHVEIDTVRQVSKLAPRPLTKGDRVWSLLGTTFPLGHAFTVVWVNGAQLGTDSGYTLQPRPGFEKRWAHVDGHPLDMTPLYAASGGSSSK